jgi:hypothetical protein
MSLYHFRSVYLTPKNYSLAWANRSTFVYYKKRPFASSRALYMACLEKIFLVLSVLESLL